MASNRGVRRRDLRSAGDRAALTRLSTLLRRLQMKPAPLTVVKPHARGPASARAAGVHGVGQAITPDNHRSVPAGVLWTPFAGRGWPFAEDVDGDDPWPFKNFRAT